MDAPQWDCLGMLTADGRIEHYGLEDALKAKYHHTRVIQDLAAYHRDSTLRFVLRGNTVRLAGNAANDPYGAGAEQIEALAKHLVSKDIPINTPIFAGDCLWWSAGTQLGNVSDWL
jgi:hypothetical protein